MKIRTNIKAGGLNTTNHNEKTAIENNNSIEEKQASGKKLRLSKETLRILKDSDLKQIAGGRRPESSTCDCGTSGC